MWPFKKKKQAEKKQPRVLESYRAKKIPKGSFEIVYPQDLKVGDVVLINKALHTITREYSQGSGAGIWHFGEYGTVKTAKHDMGMLGYSVIETDDYPWLYENYPVLRVKSEDAYKEKK